MIEFKKLCEENFNECIKLKPRDEQKDFVAPNIYSISEAYVALTNDGCPMPYAIYNDDIMVGFIMLVYEEDKDDYWICRLMIDEKYQGQGYGRASMLKALELIREKSVKEHPTVLISYEPENIVAKKLYASVGFRETGEIEEGEAVAKLEL